MMITADAENGVQLQTSENFPFVPAEQFVCKLIQEGVIGKVHKCYRLFSTTSQVLRHAVNAELSSQTGTKVQLEEKLSTFALTEISVKT